MCGRFALDAELDQLIESYSVDHSRLPEWAPRWNVAPTDTVPLIVDITENEARSRVLGPARWSLTPPWSNTLNLPYPTFNARVESAASKPTFRDAVKHTRGIIPVTAYYEWADRNGVTTPHAVRSRRGETLALAALYSTWSYEGQPTVTATILTRDAPAALAWLHDRTPIPLPQIAWSEWLDPKVIGTDELLTRAVNRSTPLLETTEIYPVAPLRGDGPSLLNPVD